MMKTTWQKWCKGLFVIAPVMLAGCGDNVWGRSVGAEYGFALDSQDMVYYSDEAKVRKMAKDPYTLQLTRFADARHPSQFANLVSENVIYEYMPDKLLTNVEQTMSGSLKRHLRFGAMKENKLNVEVELKRLRTFISTGTFYAGPFGQYVAALEADILVRDAESRVLVADKIVISLEKERHAIKGGHPSEKIDKKNMLDISKQAIRKLAVRTGWLAHAYQNAEEYYQKNPETGQWEKP